MKPDWTTPIQTFARETKAGDLPPGAVVELSEHLDDLYADALASGTPPEAALAKALAALREAPLDVVALGAARRRTHVAMRDAMLAAPVPSRSWSVHMLYALRMAVRQFVHHRAFALVTVLVLGLGIASTVTVYSILDAVVLRPLPYPEPDRLVALWDTNAEKGLTHEPISPVNFMDYKALPVFVDAAAWWRPDLSLTEPGQDPVRVRAVETGGNLFAVLGVKPTLGPGFPEGDPYFVPGPGIAVVSDRFWRAQLGTDPSVIGRTLRLNGQPYRVVGVMPPGFDYPGEIDIWQRSTWDFTQHSRNAHFMEGVARLAAGMSIEQAAAAVETLGLRLDADNPASNRAWRMRLVPLLDETLGYYRPALLVLVGAVSLLLLIGCLNVSSLLLTRALSRDREVAVRSALGASPRHLIMQMTAEAAVLAGAGSLVGIGLAAAAIPAVVAMTPLDVPRLTDVALNVRTLGLAAGLAVFMTMAFGLVPSVAILRRSLSADLKAGDRSVSRATRALYRGLVTSEVALATALLAGSGLLIRTVSQMTKVPLGVSNEAVVLSTLQLTGNAYPDWPSVVAGQTAILDLLRQHPGIQGAGGSNFLPLEPGWRMPFLLEGDVAPTDQAQFPQAQFHTVTEGYFEAIGAAPVSGRFLDSRDTTESTGAVVVNRSFAQRYLEGRAGSAVLITTANNFGPLGRNIMPRTPFQFGGSDTTITKFQVVGVVTDIKNTALGLPTEPAAYFSARQFPFRTMTLALDGPDTVTALAALRSTLRQVAPTLPIGEVTTWSARLQARTAEPRLLMSLLLFFGGLAGVLAALGVFGLFSWIVTMRQREIAIRLTLGARPSRLGARVLTQGLTLAAVGLAAGAGLVQLADALITRVLFGVSTTDARTLLVTGAVVMAASALACVPAARRAMRVDPVDGLRAD